MTKEELKEHCKKQIDMCEILCIRKGEDPHGKIYEEHKLILELLEQETVSKEVYDHEYFLRKEFELKIDKLQRQLEEQAVKAESILNKLKAAINKNIEQEDFARSVFLNEEKDYRKANQCTGNLQAYEKVLDIIDNLLKENKDGRNIV